MHLHSLFQVSEHFFLFAPSSNTFFTCSDLSLFITGHQLTPLAPSSFVLTRSSLMPNSTELWGGILKREFLWGSKYRSPHYKTKYLTAKLMYRKQTTDYKLQWSSITSLLHHAMLGHIPLTHYYELQQQYLCSNCKECSRNDYPYGY